MVTYRSYDILTAHANSREGEALALNRSIVEVDPGPGLCRRTRKGPAPTTARDFLWTCQGHAAIADLKTWIAARHGRAVPFWLPTWRRDLTLAQQEGPSSVGIVVENTLYTAMIFAQASNSRRHIMLNPATGPIYRKIISAVDNGATEALGVDSALGASVPVGTMVGYLLLCRLDTDEPEIVYRNDAKAECTLPIIEIPAEAP